MDNGSIGHLVLNRRVGEIITLKTSDGDVTIAISEIRPGRVKVAIMAPRCVAIERPDMKKPRPVG